MAIAEFSQEDNLQELQQMMSQLPNEGEKIVTNVLHNEGADEIESGIRVLVPKSGRKWKKKKQAAKRAKSLGMRKSESGNLNVIVGTTNSYHYLYFPDDGSNTKNHYGNKQFMKKGAESKAGKIIDMCLEQLTENIQ